MTLRRFVLAIVVLGLASGACADGGTEAGTEPARSPVAAGNATEAELLPTDAFALPEVDLAGYERLIGQLAGTPVVVNLWGSWCGPCRDEAPDLARAHARYGDRVQFLGLDILDARESARAFMREYGWTYPSLFDPPAAIRDELGLLGQPATLFYDETGAVVDRWVGPIPFEELERRLDDLTAA